MITRKEARELWVQALRSGKYEQETERLRGDGNKRCCLGVACDVYAELNDDVEGGSPRWMADNANSHFSPGGRRHTSSVRLPPAVRVFFGLTGDNGDLEEDIDQLGSLAELNDDGKSFEEIADIIEQGKVEVVK